MIQSPTSVELDELERRSTMSRSYSSTILKSHSVAASPPPEKLSSGLTVGFLSLLSEDDIGNKPDSSPRPAKKPAATKVSKRMASGTLIMDYPKMIPGTLQSLVTHKFSRQFTLDGFLKRRTNGVWKDYFCNCSIQGIFTLRKREDSKRVSKKYTLKQFTILKCIENQFILQDNKENKLTVFKANSEAELDRWIPTIAVSLYFLNRLLLKSNNLSFFLFFSAIYPGYVH